MENYIRMSDVQARSVPRLRTGFDELDFIYGCSDDASGLPSIWGVPAGMISLWKGRSGVGKSRLAIDIAKKVSSDAIKVLYFQNEEPLADFKGWAKGCDCNDLYCSFQNKLDQMIKVIYEVQPSLIFIDSVNKVEDFFHADGSETDRLIDSLRHALIDVGALNGGCHMILLGQADSEGNMKPAASLPHAVDTVLDVRPWNNGEVSGSVKSIDTAEGEKSSGAAGYIMTMGSSQAAATGGVMRNGARVTDIGHILGSRSSTMSIRAAVCPIPLPAAIVLEKNRDS
jgi:predicted ATP-dependent serine protease